MGAAPQFALHQPSTEAARQSRRQLGQIHARVSGAAQQADNARLQEQQSQAEIRIIEGNPPIAAIASAGHRIVTALYPLALTATGFGEWVVSVPVSIWITERLIGEKEWVVWTRIALPLAIFLVGILASYLRHRAAEEALPGDRFDLRHTLAWIVLGAMMSLTLATQLSVQPDPEADIQLIRSFWARTVGLVLLCGALHGLVLFTGRLLVESLALWHYILQRARLRNSLVRAQNAYGRHSQATVVLFSRYAQEHRDHVQRYGPTEPDAFDEVTRRILRDRLNYDPLEGPPPAMPRDSVPPTPPHATPGTSAAPPESPNGAPAGDADEGYFRRIVEEQQRDQEAEVRKEN